VPAATWQHSFQFAGTQHVAKPAGLGRHNGLVKSKSATTARKLVATATQYNHRIVMALPLVAAP
jgi:hypothetical protein